MWQCTVASSNYYLNVFGSLYKDRAVYESWSIQYLISAIVIFSGSGCALIGGIIGNKKLGIMGSILLMTGLGLFIYAQFDFMKNPIGTTIASVVSSTSLNPIWASFNNGEASWRLGYGFFIISGGSIAALVGIKLNEI